MKKIVLWMAIFLVSQEVLAQSCDDLIYFKANKKYDYTITLKANGNSIKTSYQTANVDQSGKWKTAHVNGVFSGPTVATFTGKVMCDGASLRLDAKMFAPEVDYDFRDSYIEFPILMRAGQSLKNGKLTIDMKANGKMATMVIDIVNRQVTGKEKIQTEAGTFDCFVISSTYDAGFVQSGKKINSTKTQQMEWFAPSVGIIQAEGAQSVTKLTLLSQ